MPPAEHDRALALTSHLPHLLAAALAGILPAEWQALTATGFRDTTRIAAGDPALWTAIFAAQSPGAAAGTGRCFEERLDGVQAGPGRRRLGPVHDLLTQAKKVRDALGS